MKKNNTIIIAFLLIGATLAFLGYVVLSFLQSSVPMWFGITMIITGLAFIVDALRLQDKKHILHIRRPLTGRFGLPKKK